MKMQSLLVSNTKGDKSLTATAFIYGFIVVMLKLAVSGMTIGNVTFAHFTGTECAAVLGALGVIYSLRRNKDDELSKDKT